MVLPDVLKQMLRHFSSIRMGQALEARYMVFCVPFLLDGLVGFLVVFWDFHFFLIFFPVLIPN